MPITHTFVSTAPPSPDPAKVGSTEWNDTHAASIVDADVDVAAAIAESKLALNHATHPAVTIGTANGLSLATQALSLGLASSGVTGALSGTDWDTFNGKQSALTFPLASTLGGTGVNNAGTLTNASNTTITGGGTVALGGFTLTVPATGTAALLATANVFTAVQKVNVNSALALLVEQDGVKDNTFIVDTTNGRVGIGVVPSHGFDAVCARFRMASSDVDGTSKTVALVGRHRTNAQDDITLLNLTSGSTTSVINYGGGSSNQNAATRINLYTAFTNTTNVGTQRLTVLGTGLVGIGDGLTPLARLHVQSNATITNAIAETERLEAAISTASTGGAAGFGVGQTFYAETATDGTNQQQGQISTSWIDATNASRKAKMSLSAYDTAARLGLEIEASGTAPMVGLYGVAPVIRATNAGAAGAFVANTSGIANDTATFGGYTLGQVVQALINIGILT
jgi:hypothetical protein